MKRYALVILAVVVCAFAGLWLWRRVHKTNSPPGAACAPTGFGQIVVANNPPDPSQPRQVTEYSPGASGGFVLNNSFVTQHPPTALAQGLNGNLYVASAAASEIDIYNIAGQFQANIAGDRTRLFRPVGLAFDYPIGRLYVAEAGDTSTSLPPAHRPAILIFEPGHYGNSVPLVIPLNGANPDSVAVDRSGRIYVLSCDGVNPCKLLTYNNNGLNGQPGPPSQIGAAELGFNRARDVAVDCTGKVYITVTGGNQTAPSPSIAIYPPGPDFLHPTYITNTNANGDLQAPFGIAINGSEVFVTDAEQNSVLAFSPDSTGRYVEVNKITGGNTLLRGPVGIVLAAPPPPPQPSPPSPLTITTTSLAQGTVGTQYNQAVTAEGGTMPYAWSWSAANGSHTPPGLNMNAGTGVISGTPSAAGDWNFTVQVKDASAPQQTASRAFTITTVTCLAECAEQLQECLVDTGRPPSPSAASCRAAWSACKQRCASLPK